MVGDVWSNRASALHAASSASDAAKKAARRDRGTSDVSFDASVCVQCSLSAHTAARATRSSGGADDEQPLRSALFSTYTHTRRR